jgi:hypothetical protein
VDRRSSCILAWAVASERSSALIQEIVDTTPQAAYYLAIYSLLIGMSFSILGVIPQCLIRETDRVEGDDAELRHYLARLGRHSRCFSRSIEALKVAIKLFVYAWNARQLYKIRYPKYPAHLKDFI